MQLNLGETGGEVTNILKVANIVDPNEVFRMGDEILEIQMDMKEQFGAEDPMLQLGMVMPGNDTMGGIYLYIYIYTIQIY